MTTMVARTDRGLTVTSPVDLAAVVNDAAAQAAGEATAAGVRLDLDLAAAPLSGDAALLGRLAGNLLENAIRYNIPASGGWARATTTATAEGQVTLTVSNSGPPIAPDAIDALFEPFRRLAPDRTNTRGQRGAGLGLSIVRSVTTAHGGTVTATPRPEGGLDVTVSLPADRLI